MEINIVSWEQEKNYHSFNSSELLALDWLSFQRIETDWIYPTEYNSQFGKYIEFNYDLEAPKNINRRDLSEYMITIPMLIELLSGKSPKNVKNKYKK